MASASAGGGSGGGGSSSGAFPATKEFVSVVKLINGISSSKLVVIGTRVVDSTAQSSRKGTKQQAFSEDEETELQSKLQLDSSELRKLLDGLCFVFETAAQKAMKADKLGSELTKAGMSEASVEALSQVWNQSGSALIERLKETCFAPKIMRDSNWTLSMTIASESTGTKLREPRALFSISTQDTRSGMDESLLLELNLDEMTELFNSLEQIQNQLDSLAA